MKGAHERYYLRKERIKKRIRGNAERPRLSVYRSLNQVYAQIIDDGAGKTLVSDSSRLKDFKKAAEGAKPSILRAPKQAGEKGCQKDRHKGGPG